MTHPSPHTINSVHVETARSRQRQSPVTHCLPTAVTPVYIHCRMDMFTHQNDFQKSTLSSLIIMHTVPCIVCWYVSVLSLCMRNRDTVFYLLILLCKCVTVVVYICCQWYVIFNSREFLSRIYCSNDEAVLSIHTYTKVKRHT